MTGYVGYARASTVAQVSSCPRQRQEISEFAEKHGLQLEVIFQDFGWSGELGRAHRPGWDAMLKRAEESPIVLIIEAHDRACRGALAGEELGQAMKAGHILKVHGILDVEFEAAIGPTIYAGLEHMLCAGCKVSVALRLGVKR